PRWPAPVAAAIEAWVVEWHARRGPWRGVARGEPSNDAFGLRRIEARVEREQVRNMIDVDWRPTNDVDVVELGTGVVPENVIERMPRLCLSLGRRGVDAEGTGEPCEVLFSAAEHGREGDIGNDKGFGFDPWRLEAQTRSLAHDVVVPVVVESRRPFMWVDDG